MCVCECVCLLDTAFGLKKRLYKYTSLMFVMRVCGMCCIFSADAFVQTVVI